MSLWLLFRAASRLLKASIYSPKGSVYKLINYRTLSHACGTSQFSSSLDQQLICDREHNQIINNRFLIKKLIDAFLSYFVITVVLTALSMMAFIGQPFLNNFLKQLISEKFQNTTSLLLLEVVSLYLSSKLLSSFLYIVSDFVSMLLGVKIYGYMAGQIIRISSNGTHNPKMIACIQDDCERIQNLPYCCLNSIIKIVQFLIFCSLLISRIPNYKIAISISYCIFLIVSLCCAAYSSKLNLRIMHSKQKRIDFSKPSAELQNERDNQIKSIKDLMIVDGIGLILPWVLNVLLMVMIYGVVGMNQEEKYFVLMIFGLLRSSISGLGTNLNIFAQAWSSLYRISSYLSNESIKQPNSEINENSIKIRKQDISRKYHKNRKQTKLSEAISIASQNTEYFKLIMFTLIALVFASNFLYGYCARSIIMGQSIFSVFNIVALSLQLLSPILLFSFICYSNQNISKVIYPRLLKEREHTNYSSQDVNRLSGDIRLVDRQFYFCLYGTISHITGISASFIYSSVILGNVIATISLLILVVLIAIWLFWIFGKSMSLRKECYRKQAMNKGFLLDKIKNNLNFLPTLKKIYTFKYFGYTIEIVFISLLYMSMTGLSTIFMIVVMVSNASTESSAVLIMLISQLDSQFLILFLQATILQISATAMQRCFSIFRKP